MKQFPLYQKLVLLLIGLCCALSVFAQPQGTPSPDETAKNIKILQDVFQNEHPDDIQLHNAAMAVLQLTQLGTENAVPELKKRLNVEQLNTMIRTALINTPNESGIIALRESLETLQGKNLAGVIESLGSVHDVKSVPTLIKLSDNSDKIVAESATLALGKIATPEAIEVILKKLSASDAEVRRIAAEAALFAADQKADVALSLFDAIQKVEVPDNIKDVAFLKTILADEEKGLPVFAELLKSGKRFEIVLDIANQLKSEKTSQLIIDNMKNLPFAQKARLITVLGARKNAVVVPSLITFAQGTEPLTKVAAVSALGRIGDLRGIDAVLGAIDPSDPQLVKVAKNSLTLLQGEGFNETIIKVLDSPEKSLRLTVLHVIGERHITDAIPKVKQFFNDADEDIRIAAYSAFANSITPTTADIELMLGILQNAVSKKVSEGELSGIRDSLRPLCWKIADRDAGVEVIAKQFDNVDTESKLYLLEILIILINEKAAKMVADAALSQEDVVRDKATEVLGRWITVDAAPFLLELAQKFPVGSKYQVRTLRGYLRIIRQMGLPPEEKVEMSKKALALASRDEDKKLAQETLDRFSRISRGTPLFDGKTFENWEFRNEENARWFCIQIRDSAIIGGTLKENIPRNEFITTKKEYGDFTLRLEAKVIGNGGNGGVQFRSQRLTEDSKKPNEMSGYQADMTNTFKFWGSLYDESRRAKFLAEAKEDVVKPIFRENDWNELEIVCKGDTITISLNGVQTVEYKETDEKIPRKGLIGLQIHAGGPSEAWYRNIRIEEN